jgi:drug/metabolite transporter (DMT)-like permease
LCFGIYLLVSNKFDSNFFSITASDWIWLLLLAIICTAFAFIAAVHIMKNVSAFTVALTSNLEPVYGIILALIIFTHKEQMKPSFYIGTFIILLTVIINGLMRVKKKTE